MPPPKSHFLLPLLLAALPGCFASSTTPFDAARSRPEWRAMPAADRSAEVPATSSEPSLTRRGVTRGYRVLDLELPSSGANRQPGNLLRARYFQRREGEARGTVLVLPIWGRSNYPPRALTRRLLRSGELDVLRVLEERALFDWRGMRDAPTPEAFLAALDASAASLAATIDDLGTLVRWLARRRQPADHSIAVVGFSIGAIIAGDLLGSEPDLSRGALIMGGAHLETIFANCEKRAGRVREELMARFDLDREAFERLVADRLRTFDPIHTAHRIDPRSVLYVDARYDDCIPRENRDHLWRALSRPERIQLHTTHRQAFMAMTPFRGHWLTRRIDEFLHRPWRLAGELPAETP